MTAQADLQPNPSRRGAGVHQQLLVLGAKAGFDDLVQASISLASPSSAISVSKTAAM